MPVQPEIHLCPSADTPYAFVAALLVLVLAQKAGLQKVGVANWSCRIKHFSFSRHTRGSVFVE